MRGGGGGGGGGGRQKTNLDMKKIPIPPGISLGCVNLTWKVPGEILDIIAK